jgi:hypothetical protein
MKEYKIGDIININDVNNIKNELFRKELPNPYNHTQWGRIKRDIKKRVKFQIVSL